MAFSTVDCASCGVQFCVPDHWLQAKRESKAEFFCPNGHSLSYRKSRADELAEKLESQQRETNRQRDRAETLERQLSATKGVVTKYKVRASNGACLCCKRSFKDLARHMATKHPDFKNQETA